MKIAGDVMENDIIKKGGLIFAKKLPNFEFFKFRVYY